MRKLLLVATAALSFAVPGAAATTYNFSLTGSFTATWSMPVSPTPTFVGPEDAGFNLTTFTLPDNSTFISEFGIFGSVTGGGIGIGDPANYDGRGDLVYTGTLAAPTFKLGTFTLYGSNNIQNGILTISDPNAVPAAVPEPASWAMLIAGFGLTGAALCRRRTGLAAA